MKRALLALLAIALLAFLAWRFLSTTDPAIAPNAPATAAESKIENPKPVSRSLGEGGSKIPARPTAPAADVSDLAQNLNSPSTDIRADLRIVSDVIEAFRTNFLQTGNPVGANAEITAALAGKNKLRFAFIAPNHPAINKAGELCDRWGMPFFFHAQSATKMEIRSAGPDKKMWTDDDAVLSP